MSLKEAFKFVRSKRSVVSPNLTFKNQLELFEKLSVEKKYDFDKIKFDEIKWEPKDYNELKIDYFEKLNKYHFVRFLKIPILLIN